MRGFAEKGFGEMKLEERGRTIVRFYLIEDLKFREIQLKYEQYQAECSI